MNLEKKAVIIGAVWGFISGYLMTAILILTTKRVVDFPLNYKIGLAPAYIYTSLILPIMKLPLSDIALISLVVLPITIGALIGYGIAKIYHKVKK